LSMLFKERSLRKGESPTSALLNKWPRSSDRMRGPWQPEESTVRGILKLSTLSRQHKIRCAVLQCFSNPFPEQLSMHLRDLTGREWRSLLRWLDVSGLALYLLDQLSELQLSHIFPAPILTRLQQNMLDNTRRTRSMLQESTAIQREFQERNLSYAVLKGASLYPESVPRLELRHQFDLDFLIAQGSVTEGRQVLERQGYRLYAVSGASWEFKKDEQIGVSMEDFYKDTSGRTVELHVQPQGEGGASVLSRVETRQLYGIDMPVLSPIDLFLGQAMHAYKHICGEFSRTAHLLEFYRHVGIRRDDDLFWSELRAKGAGDPKLSLGLGVVTLLISTVMGDFAPHALTEWTVDRLSPTVRLWINLHGPRTVFGDVPGNKLYLLLQREIEPANPATSRRLIQALLPRRLPPLVVRAANGESLSTRARRYRVQLFYALLRLRFHVVEGARYGLEAHRWSKLRKDYTR